MKLLKTLWKLFLSLLLWVLLLTPRLIVLLISIAESLLSIIKSTTQHLIEQTKNEVLK